jgi:predicted GTPase
MTIDGTDAEVLVAATPVDRARLVTVRMPIVRARYEFEDTGDPRLADLIDRWLASRT